MSFLFRLIQISVVSPFLLYISVLIGRQNENNCCFIHFSLGSLMKNVVANKVLKSKASSRSLKRDNTSGSNGSASRLPSRDNSKLSKSSIQELDPGSLVRDSSRLSLTSVKSNIEDYTATFNRNDSNRLSQKSTQSANEQAPPSSLTPSSSGKSQSQQQLQAPNPEGTGFTDLAAIDDEHRKSSSLDSGTGSCSPPDSQSGSNGQLPNNHVAPKTNKKTEAEVNQPKAPVEKTEQEPVQRPSSGKQHNPVRERKSNGATSVNAIELTPIDDSKV